jgi:hypothetical protein
VRGELDVKPAAASLSPTTERGQRPSRAVFERSVVATREPKRGAPGSFERTAAPTSEDAATPAKSGRIFGRGKVTRDESEGTAARVVPAPKRGNGSIGNRPPFGGRTDTVERAAPPKPPRFGEARERAADVTPSAPQTPGRGRSRAPETQGGAAPAAPRGRSAESPTRESRSQESAPAAPRDLPGEPANRVFRGRGSDSPRMAVPQQAPQQHQTPPQQGGSHHGGRPRQDGGQQGSPPQGGQSPASPGGGFGGRGRDR